MAASETDEDVVGDLIEAIRNDADKAGFPISPQTMRAIGMGQFVPRNARLERQIRRPLRQQYRDMTAVRP